MTDLPSPPPAGSTPLPPPPAPGLVAPPVRDGYDGGRPVSLKRVAGVQRALVVLVVMSATAAGAALIAGFAATSDAEAFLAGEIDADALVEAMTPTILLSFVQGLAVVATAVLTMIWMYRMAANLRALHRGATWGPGWAIGGWFLPPLVYVIPYLMFRELWKASDPDSPSGADWRARPVAPIVVIWFVLYSLMPVALLVFHSGDVLSALAASEQQMAEQLVDGRWSNVADAAVTIAGAAALVVLASSLGARHRRLTGEQSV